MSGRATLTFWDVGHGHATYIKTPPVSVRGALPKHRHLVIDLGTKAETNKSAGFRPVSELDKHLAKPFERWLDCLIVTHPHRDHIDEIDMLVSPVTFLKISHLELEEVKEMVDDPADSKFKRYCDMVESYNQNAPQEYNLENEDNWGGISFYQTYAKNYDGKELNNHSLLIVLKFGETKIIIPGDNEEESLDELMEDQNFVNEIKDSAVLLAPHHGRKSSFHEQFVDTVNPKITIISEDNNIENSAEDYYQKKSTGHLVHSRAGIASNRKCLRTSSVGNIEISFSSRLDDLDILTDK